MSDPAVKKKGRSDADVLILGAGLAGLAAAEGVLAQGLKPVVIEKEPIVGGMCASVRKNGFIFDFGGHRFLPHRKETADYVRSLFKDGELLLRPRRSQIYLNGRYLMYPPEALDIIKKLGWRTSLECALQGLGARLRHLFRRPQELSLEDWLMGRFGRRLYDIYFGPYSRKLWGASPSLISSDWAPQRISVASIGVVLSELLKRKGRRSIPSYARQFLYPVGGCGKIPEGMADRVKRLGGDVLLGHRAVKVTRSAAGYAVEARNGDSAWVGHGRSLIVAMPLPEFVRMFHPAAPADILEAARHLRFRSVRFLNLMVDMPELTRNTWVYVPEEKFTFFRIQEFHRWCPGNAPKGRIPLTLEIACQKGDDLWTMPEEALLPICLRDLKLMGLDLKGRVLDCFSTTAEHAYPFYAIGYRRYLGKISRWIEGFEGLIPCGRQGMFRYMNMDLAIEGGFQAAKTLESSRRAAAALREKEDPSYLEADLYLRNK